MGRMLNSLQRVISSNKFIPEIDGLRFIAIVSVLMFHLNGFISAKDPHIYSDLTIKNIFDNIFDRGHLGVELFFAISGFVLSYPFAMHYLKNGNRPELKTYFIRRITRLEPPYIICMVVLFLASIAIGKYTSRELIPSLFASLTYTHNFFYPGVLPLVNLVAWSLEIEIQFYILAPLLATIFKLSSSARRTLIVVISLAFILFQSIVTLPFKSLLGFAQYFFIGFLLADLVISEHKLKFNKKVVIVLLGLVSFVAIWACDATNASGVTNKLLLKTGLFASVFVFYYMVLFSAIWKKIFSIKILTVIGGMCYTIYLWHCSIISMVGNPLVRRFSVSHFYFLNWFFYCLLLFVAVALTSICYFKLIEQPCMKKNWHMELLDKVKKRFMTYE